MIYVLAILSYIVLASLAPWSGGESSSARSFRELLLKNAYDFALPFTATVWAFATFSAVLSWKLDPGAVNIALLMHAEAFAGEVQTILASLKIPKALLLVLLAVIFICSILSVREQHLAVFVRGLSPGLARLARVLKRAREYNKPLSSLVAGLTAATLFTFFGAVPGLPETDLQARLKNADHTLGQFEEALDRIIRQDIVAALMDHALSDMPQAYRSALADLLERARPIARDLQQRISAGNPKLEGIRRQLNVAAPAEASGSADTMLAKARNIESAFDPALMPGLTAEALRLDLLIGQMHESPYGTLLALEAGRQLARELLPFVFEGADILDPVAMGRIHPVLKPIAEVITDSVDDRIKSQLDRAAFQIRRDVLAKGSGIGDLQKRARQAVSTNVTLRIDAQARRMSRQATTQLKEQTEQLAAREQDLRATLEQVRVGEQREARGFESPMRRLPSTSSRARGRP